MSLRLIYVDDSGAESTGYAMFSAVMVAAEDWKDGLSAWLTWRQQMMADHQIPKNFELHATKFVTPRGHPSLSQAWNGRPENRILVFESALRTLHVTPCISVATAYRQTSARSRQYGMVREDVYEHFVHDLDAHLTAHGDVGIIVMDGDGRDPSYKSTHRGLDLGTRSIIEDPVFQHSHVSQWIQMADLAAWSTYQGLLRHPGKQFAHDWYQDFLQPSDVWGTPRAV